MQEPSSWSRRPRVAALEPFVAGLSYIRNPPACPDGSVGSGGSGGGLERVLPDGYAALMIELRTDRLWAYDLKHGAEQRAGPIAVCGPYASPVLIDPARLGSIISVSFRPGGTVPFVRAPASELAGGLVDLEALWGPAATRLRERLLEVDATAGPPACLDVVERALLDRLVRPLEADPILRAAVAGLGHGASVGSVRERLGLTPRQALRMFDEQIGLSPKRFARVRRFQRVLRAVAAAGDRPVGPGADAAELDWSRIAVEHGFADQSHLINEFRDLGGITPGTYRPVSAATHNHVPGRTEKSAIATEAPAGTMTA